MPTLVESVRGLSSKIKSLAGSQLAEQDAAGFGTRAEQLSELAYSLVAPAACSERFAGRIPTDLPSSEAKALQDIIDDIRHKFEVDPRTILVPNTKWRFETQKRLGDFAHQVNVSLLESWRTHVEKARDEVGSSEGLLRVLQTSPAYADRARRIIELETRINGFSERLPQNQTELEEPERLRGELRDATANLPQDLPEPVSVLFEAISRGTANASLLTDEALNWLREKELLHTLRISWGRIEV